MSSSAHHSWSTTTVTGSPTLGTGDFDGDGLADYAGETFDGSLFVWPHAGAVAEAELPLGQDSPSSMAVADINGDRVDDVATATYAGKLIVSRNAPSADAAPTSLSLGSAMVTR